MDEDIELLRKMLKDDAIVFSGLDYAGVARMWSSYEKYEPVLESLQSKLTEFDEMKMESSGDYSNE